jgi:ankyrin repeat protein
MLLALVGNNVEALDQALAEGADPNLDLNGWYPVHIAAAMADPTSGALNELLTYGANANSLDRNGRTPLHYVAVSGSAGGAARILMAYRANCDVKDGNNESAIDLAERLGRQELARQLRTSQMIRKGSWGQSVEDEPKGPDTPDSASR